MVLLLALGSAAAGAAGAMALGNFKTQTSHKYKLIYFDARGVIELTRYMFHMSGTPYEETRFPFNFGVPGDFSTIKRPEFDKAKLSGELDVAMGKVPVLVVDGVKVSQSKAIDRFIAKQLGFMGSSQIEELQIDMMCEHIRDINFAYQKVKGISDPKEKKAGMNKWFAEELPQYAKQLEKATPEFLMSCGITLADLNVYYLFTFFFDRVADAQKAIAPCPKLFKMNSKVKADAKAQDWEARRPKNMF